MRSPRFSAAAVLTASLCLSAAPRHSAAERFLYEPLDDDADGMLLDAASWDGRTGPDLVEEDLHLSLGETAGTLSEVFLAFACPEWGGGATPAHAALRFGAQGGAVSAPFDVAISGALALDPLAATGAARFALPRTGTTATWRIDEPWEHSGQRIAKWRESPDVATIVAEIMAQPGWDTGPRVVALFLEVPDPVPSAHVAFDDTHPRWQNGGNAGIAPARLVLAKTPLDAFWGRELLCRPTPRSVEVNVIPHRPAEAYVEFGASAASMPRATALVSGDSATGIQMRLHDLSPDTRYSYRLRYRFPGDAAFAAGPVRAFVSLPEPGGAARLAVTTDMHVTNQIAHGMDTMLDLLATTLDALPRMHALGYHAWIDLGDAVVVRAQRAPFDLEEAEQRYRAAREYVELAGHSVPLLFVRGNHEEVNGWDLDDTSENTAVWSGRSLLKWFPPPLPNEFYSGNESPVPFVGLPGNYFACTIGDVRVRCLDPYLASTTRPHNGHGETGGSLDPWDWRIGDAQYAWLAEDLAAHPTPYRLTALHHLTSSFDEPGYRYGRGGIEVAKWRVAGRPSFEWGGEDATGTSMIATRRPAYTDGALHDLLAARGNQVVVKGHDHLFARQELDGMVYVTLAKPDDTGQLTGHLWGWKDELNYPDSVSIALENSGFLSIVADRDRATFEYVRTYPSELFGVVSDAFTVLPHDLDTTPSATSITSITGIAPNPARTSPRIEFQLARAGSITLAVRDLNGRLVRELVRGERMAGDQEVTWDRADTRGRRVASGVYFVELRTDAGVDAVKLLVLR